ncbi:Vacuolar calcium ion transporter [Colletotrichum spinosum]|uniref:Vacuolar calcium ion transporter n=1 Tax=Colletotrichum spinosum TaxID=1347390 RepID=A0A4R8PSU4_9PEZI|nr:Vacuolar calcium ion transporter [Colletotrichum spinosum]
MPTERSPLLLSGAIDGLTSPSRRGTSVTQSEHTSGGFYKAWHETKTIMLSNHLHWLLVIFPFAISAPKRSWSPVTVFTVNSFATMPLKPKKLLRAASGNSVEFVVGVLALKNDLFRLARSIVLGSVLFSLLSSMGMCFFLGGIANMRDRVSGRGVEQSFPPRHGADYVHLDGCADDISRHVLRTFGDENLENREQGVLALSRGASIIFLPLYITHHWYKSRTHSDPFRDETVESQPDETEDSATSLVTAVAILIVTVALAVMCAENLVRSINSVAEVTHLGPSFIGFVLVPIALNAAKTSAAVGMARRRRMDLAMDVILNSVTETGLLIVPSIVILPWAVFHKSMALQFELVPTIAYVFATLAAAVVVRDGQSNYLEGALLLGFYVIIVLAVFFGPVDG